MDPTVIAAAVELAKLVTSHYTRRNLARLDASAALLAMAEATAKFEARASREVFDEAHEAELARLGGGDNAGDERTQPTQPIHSDVDDDDGA